MGVGLSHGPERRSDRGEPKEGEVTEGNLGFPLFVTGEPERSEGDLGFPLFVHTTSLSHTRPACRTNSYLR